MRVFLAIELDDAVRDRIATLQDELKGSLRSARWVAPQNLHVTLRFLGDVSDRDVDALSRALPHMIGDARAFELELRGVGSFPNARRARVLWAGIDPIPDSLDALHALDRSIQDGVTRHGFAPDDRPFAPHVTIARWKSPDRSLARALDGLGGVYFGKMSVSELVMFESQLSPRGPRYRAHTRIPLGGTRRKQLV